jgi:DnaJ-class molecular chaperone with C-terminal Zn finger domain
VADGQAGASGLQYKDYYAVLGVPKTASQAEIKRAFRKLARQHHPDARPGDKVSEQRFKEINEANEVLSAPAKRKKYDALGADWQAYERSGGAAPGGGRGGSGDPFGPGGPFAGYARSGARSGGSGQTRYEFRTGGGGGEGFSDFFEMFFGADGPARQPGRVAQAGPAGGPGRAARPAAPPPRTVHEATAEITLDEAYHGTTRLVQVDGKRLEITLPAGADTGTRIRLSGRGPGGGDLVVVVKQMPDARFVRRGADLDRDLLLTLQEALLGADVHVETLKGRVSLKIPAGTQNGRTFRLTGRGMPRFKATGHGDLFVKAKVVLPRALSDEAATAARTLFDLVDQPSPR